MYVFHLNNLCFTYVFVYMIRVSFFSFQLILRLCSMPPKPSKPLVPMNPVMPGKRKLEIVCSDSSDSSDDNYIPSYLRRMMSAKRVLNGHLSSISDPPDGVLIVGNDRIPIHKMYLSYYSDFFKTMFQSEFKEGREDEIVLEEVEYGEMIELLSVIYPSATPINDKNIKSILKLADRFVMPAVLERCKEAIRNSTIIKGAEKLLLAQHYNFTDLQKELAQQYKTVQDVKKLKSEAAYNQLDNNTLVLLFHSITS
ncbi:BTB/POZ domain-containing protein [Ditylenchus destructor]|nr:BTB/POZ domain-containing protein [Ditylenchus destructor]